MNRNMLSAAVSSVKNNAFGRSHPTSSLSAVATDSPFPSTNLEKRTSVARDRKQRKLVPVATNEAITL